MESLGLFFSNLYQNFNDHRIDLVIENMADDVQWANGMEAVTVNSYNTIVSTL